MQKVQAVSTSVCSNGQTKRIRKLERCSSAKDCSRDALDETQVRWLNPYVS